jgi:gluconate 2-dehydrogenase gamma chain
MTENDISRRAFLRHSLLTIRNSMIVLSLPAILENVALASEASLLGSDFTTLNPEEAEEYAAIAARIIPTDETPGASEAGVIHFIDNVLGTSRTEMLGPLREGLASLQESVRSAYGELKFSELDPQVQDALLQGIEDTPFFATMRYLTIAGMFSLPDYGGNRDHSGWQLIGFEHRHVWEPPFGFYDADYMARGE